MAGPAFGTTVNTLAERRCDDPLSLNAVRNADCSRCWKAPALFQKLSLLLTICISSSFSVLADNILMLGTGSCPAVTSFFFFLCTSDSAQERLVIDASLRVACLLCTEAIKLQGVAKASKRFLWVLRI